MCHKSGKNMSHVDTLSRSVAYVNALPLERELEVRQLTDPRLKEISEELEQKENSKFTLIDGLLYRTDGDHSRFVVPESMISPLIRAHHDEMGHVGPEKTFQGLNHILVSFDEEKNF